MVTIIIRDEDSEVQITRQASNLEDMLMLIEDTLKACGYQLKGNLIIAE
jgi:hypothetical protein